MTPDERLQAIQAQLANDTTYAVGVEAENVRWLLRYAESLRAVAEAAEGMPPMVMHGEFVDMCLFCFASTATGREISHSGACRYGLLRAALQRWREVQG